MGFASADGADPSTQALLSVCDLTVRFPTERGDFTAVSGLDFDVKPGRTLAIVGESGSGKSVTALSILRLVEFVNGRIVSGHMTFRPRDGEPIDLATASDDTMRRIRGNRISMIFQEPMTSLNPVFTVGDQITEAIVLHQGLSHRAARREARDLLEKVRLPDAAQQLSRYPHQLSGGMRQRVMIAMALSCRPQLLIADEPTTALDVTIQAQILNTIRELQREMGAAVVFITHDMGVVAEMADEVVVMRHGRKVEQAGVHDVFGTPWHPYTKALLAAVPRLGSMAGEPFPKRLPLVVVRDGATVEIGEEHIQDTVRADAPLLALERVTTRFDARRDLIGRVTHRVHAAEQISLEVHRGETLALVGESGSGKSTIGRTIQGLLEATEGTIRFEGRDVAAMNPQERRRLKREIQYIFQDPFGSLDPRKTVGFTIAEPIRAHALITGKAAIRERVADLLRQVGLEPEVAERYPHEFSGGQRARICIARALSCDPKLLIADESIASLDVSIQAQIVNLLMELQDRRALSYLFITHDMAVVEKISHRVAVMYMGQIVEIGPRRAVFENPQHPYTRKLLAAVPVPIPGRQVDTRLITGEIPSPLRAVGDEPAINRFVEVKPGHLVAIEEGRRAS